ncbi:MAG: DNA polymerase III subunit gamma/tau [Sulfurovum sp.]|nr:DNA polymerase III subunit gamma/tau [Sulfurovum sp.]
MSLALARKYRPATFNDLIGQEAVSQTLSLALDNQRLSHAYLFSGLRGSGKTSTARIFAKALLCEKGASSHPCGECIHCVMAAENRHMDIIEMDAASNRGIDDIKDLIEHTKYKPSSARYKIFIIDEVHMLTNQAFNALLKTLEEPPDFVKFILATTDPLKLPATILSRTQHFRFKKIPQNLVEKHLEHILNLEKIGFEKEAVEIIARSGAGSLRDSLTLLDQAIVYSQNFVDVATVTGMLGIIEPSMLEKLLTDIINKNTDALLGFIREAADYEAEMILDELTLYLKSLLLNGSGKLSAMIIERFFRIIAEAKSLLSLGSDGEFVLSLSLFKMVEALQIKDIDAMIRGLEQELKGVEVSEIVVTTPAPDLSTPKEVITITEEEILAPEIPSKTQSDERLAPSVEKEEHQETLPKNEDTINQSVPTPTPSVEETSSPTQEPAAAPQTESATTVSTKEAPVLTNTDNNKETGNTVPPLNTQHSTLNTTLFDTLVKKIYDRDYDLGSCFERNITFVSFEANLLTWESIAEEEEKKMLIKHWGIINMFVKEIFGLETKIKNIAKKKAPTASSEQTVGSVHRPKQPTQSPNTTNQAVPHSDADSGSMIEEVEMKSSCIAPDAGDTEAAKEKDPSTLLEEPMIKAAMDLFSPKKVRIKKNV